MLRCKRMNVLKYRRTKIQKYKSIKVQKKECAKEETCERRNVRKKKRANMQFHNRISARFILGKSKNTLFTFLPFYSFTFSELYIVLFFLPLIVHRKEEPFFVVVVRTANGSDTIALEAHVGNSEGGIRLITILAVHLD